MKLNLKLTLILTAFFLSTQGFAYTPDYASVFKPAQENKSVSEFQSNLKKDISKVRSLMNLEDKKVVGFMEDDENPKSERSPAEI